MSLARLVITAVTVEGHSKSQVARDYGVSRVWIQKLLRRFQAAEGEAAVTPRSRRPHGNPRAVSVDLGESVLLSNGWHEVDVGVPTFTHG
jgi:hypothetical protein